MYDVIIIGAGIAGLYYSYLLKKSGNSNFIIIEKNNKIGGRVGYDTFYNQSIITGAGIGRYNKDKLLVSLLKDLKIDYKTYTAKINYILPFKPVPILKTVENLKKSISEIDLKLTFKDFLIKKLGKEGAYQFICSSGYTDYLSADIIDTLYDYGFDDNIGGYTAIKMPWKELLDKLSLYLKDHILLNTYPVSIGYKKIELRDKELFGKKLILAIPPKQVYKLLRKKDYILSIKNNIFMRYYVKLDKIKSSGFINNIDTFTFLQPPIQKIIPISREEGIYMLSYSDNKSAKWIEDNKNNWKLIENIIFDLTGYTIKIEDSRSYYWEEGTHHYTPLNKTLFRNRDESILKLQHPEDWIYVVGEAYSKNQGWVEGALESVIKIY